MDVFFKKMIAWLMKRVYLRSHTIISTATIQALGRRGGKLTPKNISPEKQLLVLPRI